MSSGRIVDDCDGTPMSGVVVSNGCECVLTDDSGGFALPGPATNDEYPSRGFVSVCLPSGYRSVGDWYHGASDSDVVFRLAPDPVRGGETFTFAVLADLHLGKYPYDWLRADLAAIENEAGIQCVVSIGDMTQSGLTEEYEGYLDACTSTALPVIHVPGNHDWSTDKNGQTWASFMGPAYFSFDWGPIHVVCFDSTAEIYRPDLPQSQWLANDLALVPPDKPIALMMHDQRTEEFYAPLRSRSIVASFSGHWHSSRLYDDGHTVHVNQPTGSMGGIDYSARGYTVVSLDGTGGVDLRRRLIGTSRRGRQTGVCSVPEPPSMSVDVDAPEVRVGDDWPQFKGGPARTGASADGPVPPLARKWQTRLPGGLLFGSPVISDAAVYIAALDEEDANGGALVSLDARTGRILWQVPTNGSVKHAPAIWRDLVVTTTVTGRVTAVDRTDGHVVWTHQLNDPSRRWVFSGPLVVEDGVFVGTAQCVDALHAPSGEVIWSWRREGEPKPDWISSYSCPVADDRNVYLGFFWHYEVAFAFDQATGAVRWVIDEPTRASPVGTPALGDDGTLYNTCHDATVRAHSTLDGREIWRHDMQQSADLRSGPRWSAGSVAVADRRAGGPAARQLYVPTGDGSVRCLDAADGCQIWEWWSEPAAAGVQAYARDGKSVLSSPVVCGDTLYVGASDGRIVALDVSLGRLLWSDDLEAPVISSPAVSGNLLVCGASDGWLYAWTGGNGS
jgi:outer membrane protein assembly factor BamB/predicted phosphodiesterase